MTTVAVVGAGNWGRNLVRNFYNLPQARLKWVVDSSEDRLAKMKGLFPRIEATTDVGRVLEDDEVAAVVVAAMSSSPAGSPRSARNSALRPSAVLAMTVSAKAGTPGGPMVPADNDRGSLTLSRLAPHERSRSSPQQGGKRRCQLWVNQSANIVFAKDFTWYFSHRHLSESG